MKRKEAATVSDLRNELLDCYNELIDADYEAAASSAEKEQSRAQPGSKSIWPLF